MRSRPTEAIDRELFDQLDQLLLARYCPAAVLVDDEGTLVSCRGPMEALLEPAYGAQGHGLHLTGSSLNQALRAGIDRARREQSSVTSRGVVVERDGVLGVCDLVVMRVPEGMIRRGSAREPPLLFLVTFEGLRVPLDSSGDPSAATEYPAMAPGRTRAPRELAASRGTNPYAGLHGLRVLAVDDDPGTLAAVEDVLRLSGSVVRGAASAREATAVLDEFDAQVLVCDIAMPDEDGYRFLRRLRARGSAGGGDIAALALTALARAEDQQLAIAAGFQLHLAKPVDIDRLRDAVLQLAKIASSRK